jgi:hypothetical protein
MFSVQRSFKMFSRTNVIVYSKHKIVRIQIFLVQRSFKTAAVDMETEKNNFETKYFRHKHQSTIYAFVRLR